MCVSKHRCGGQRTSLQRSFSLSIGMEIQGIKSRSPELGGKCLSSLVQLGRNPAFFKYLFMNHV